MRLVFALPLVAALLVGCVGSAFTSDLTFHVGTGPDGSMYVEPPGATTKAGKVRMTIVNDDLAAANAEKRSGAGREHDLLLRYHSAPAEGNSLEEQRCRFDLPGPRGPGPGSLARFSLVDHVEASDVFCLRAGHDGPGATYRLTCQRPGHTEQGALTVVP